MKLWNVLVFFVVTSLSTGCSDDDDDNPTEPGPVGIAQVRVAHLSPDAPPVDVWVDGQVALSNVPFRAFSSYLELAEGNHRVEVTPTGAETPIVIDETVTVQEGQSYTIFARGLLGGGTIDASVLADDRMTSTQAELRFVHASPDAPAVDITLTDGTVLFGNVAFPSTKSIAVGAGTYDLQVRVAGTSTVVLSFGDVAVSGNSNYSVWAVGRLGDGSLDALVTVDAPGMGSAVVDLTPAKSDVRVAHLSPDAPNVDVWVDGAVVSALRNVPFLAVSGYLELSAKTTNVKVFPTGATTNPVIDANLTLLPGIAYTVAATGLVGEGDLAPLVLVDDREPGAANSTKVRFVHASPDAPAVVVRVADGPVLFPSSNFRDASDYVPVNAGTYDLEVELTSNQALALAIPGVMLTGGTNVTVFAVGQAANGTLAALPAVDTP